MTLTPEAFAVASKPPRMRCGIVKILVALEPKDQAVLQAAIDNPDVTHSAIAKVLADNGHPIKEGAVSRHRRGGCACGG